MEKAGSTGGDAIPAATPSERANGELLAGNADGALLVATAGQYANARVRRHNVIVWSRALVFLIVAGLATLVLSLFFIWLFWRPY